MARRLPVGGRGAAERTPYQPLPLAEAISGFLASPHAAGLGTAQRAAAELLLAAAESRAGSPLRWSGVTVEVLLMDELPWDADAGEEVLDAIPDALEPVIRYAHGVQGISPEGTRTALDAVRDGLAGGWPGPDLPGR